MYVCILINTTTHAGLATTLLTFSASSAVNDAGFTTERVMDQHTRSLAISNDAADARTNPSSANPYVPLSYADLQPAAQAPRDWLWQGYLRPGAVTLLTSLWKSGKSTLLAVLLSRLKSGGVLAGLPVRAGRAVVVSEEPPQLWWERGHNLALDGPVQWFCKPFQGKPAAQQWLDLLALIGRMHDRQPLDLLAIDPLANLASMRTENDAAEMLKAVAPLQRLTSRGVSVLLCHHPKKGPVLPGQAARGSGALSAYADIILEMQAVCRRNPQDRRRRLRAYSRYAATPPTWVIEWTADGADYLGLGPSAEPDFAHGWPVLQALLANAEGPMTRRALFRAWPDSAAAPAKLTLWKWLTRTVREGHVLQQGSGTRKEPYQYSLPGMSEKWQANFVADFIRSLEPDAEPPQPQMDTAEHG
jgi:hypothetical protein